MFPLQLPICTSHNGVKCCRLECPFGTVMMMTTSCPSTPPSSHTQSIKLPETTERHTPSSLEAQKLKRKKDYLNKWFKAGKTFTNMAVQDGDVPKAGPLLYKKNFKATKNNRISLYNDFNT